MLAKVQKWGNSQGVRLAKPVLAQAHLGVGEAVEVVARDGAIVLLPVRRVRGRVRLASLVARIPPDYRAREVDWGGPRGRETW
ncbi:MAG: transcriptional regulator/antitoxin, MazE [Deltaproteobacteria bacterium]|nr:transcriptional regulator/antitoxin, MazE [Deltaproteobacteria bacterium]